MTTIDERVKKIIAEQLGVSEKDLSASKPMPNVLAFIENELF